MGTHTRPAMERGSWEGNSLDSGGLEPSGPFACSIESRKRRVKLEEWTGHAASRSCIVLGWHFSWKGRRIRGSGMGRSFRRGRERCREMRALCSE